jgi:IS605 OrfB family transposase
MGAIYRSYEVLVEETARDHKTRNAGKTGKDFRPHYENTCRALGVTHDLFQDAVCYYILCLVGLVKNERDENGEPINRMWGLLHGDSMSAATEQIALRVGTKYFNQSCLGACASEKLLELVYPSHPSSGEKLADKTVALKSVYLQLARAAFQAKKQGKGENAITKAALTDMAKFASNWYQRLSNPASTQGGQEIESRNNAYWLGIAAELKPTVEPELRSDFDDAAFAKRLELRYCFNSPVADLSSEDALKDYGSAFGVVESDGSKLKPFWNKPPKTVVAALKRYASPVGSNAGKVTFDSEVSLLRNYAHDDQQRAKFEYPAAASGSKPSGTYWLSLRYRFAPSPRTRWHLFENIKKRRETDAADPLAAVRCEFGFVFPFFTNLLGLTPRSGKGAIWTGFDKSAFKRAAEEVFKYKIRSDARKSLIEERRRTVDAMEATINGDPRKELMEGLLGELGGAVGYGMRRATIGGWADLRQEFLTVANRGEPVDEDKLLAAIEKAREESGGGFGSGAFFKALCEEKYHPLWLPTWKNKQAHHPKNFVRWWVLYSEAREELAKVWDDESKAPKSIAFTWPGTKNRHGEMSFRPLDFNIQVTPAPEADLFDCEGDGKPIRLIRTNANSRKGKSNARSAFTDSNGNPLYPLTLSYRRLKRDRIADSEGSSVEAEYAPPLVTGKAPAFDEPGERAPLDSSASLLPADRRGCWHFMFSFKLEREMQKLLADGAAKVPGEKSIRVVKKSGKWVGLNLRWPIDLKTENPPEKDHVAPVSFSGEEIEDTDAKFSIKKIWCSNEFKPFDILSVDLGVRYAGAWCRGRVKTGRDTDRPYERTISSDGHGREIVFDAYDFGTFRLQGEDAKIWRKDGHRGFGDKPAVEKCGSRGRVATDSERSEFKELAGRLFPASVRFPIPDNPPDIKFFPELGEHLTYRLRRRLGRIRFLFKLRWQIKGKRRKIGHAYQILAGDELKTFRGEQRFNAIAALTFSPKEDKPEETEDDFLRGLRLSLAADEVWSKLVFEHERQPYPLFAKIKGGPANPGTKRIKSTQKASAARLRTELQSDNETRWDWAALAERLEQELSKAMQAFAGSQSLMAEVARFVWPLQDKKWKWISCEPNRDGKQSVLVLDENSTEPKRFTHGMRGLNVKRIRLMQDFRQCCQSLAKLERRFYTDGDKGLEPSPVQLSERVHEPAPAFIDKINDLREQRVNQTAHMVLAEALGLDLMNPAEVEIDGKSKCQLKSERDLHGRYEHKRPRVAAIVLEDLSRYRTSQDRSRYENSQLMEWSHRAIIGKLQDMAQVFGLQIITVDARFSSRFCSRTGVPGIRCAEVAKGFENEYPWKKWAEEEGERAKLIQSAAEVLNKCTDPKLTLVLPMDGGPAFLPVIPHAPGKQGLEANADINAAINIGLRAVGHPDRLDIFPVMRTEAKSDGALEVKNRRGSMSESAARADTRIVSPALLPTKERPESEEAIANEDAGGDEELETGKFPYLYAVVGKSLAIADESRYQLPRSTDGRVVTSNDKLSVSAAKGKLFWSRVKQACWKRIKQVNAKRLQDRGIDRPTDWLKE